MASVADAIKHWASAHVWSLQTIAEEIPTPTTQTTRAANTFELAKCGIARRAEGDFMDDARPALEAVCRNFTAVMRTRLPEDSEERQAFAGFIPAVFHFQPTGMVSYHKYPIYRLRAHGSGPSYEHPCTEDERALFNDVLLVCAKYMNRGLVLRAPGGDYNQPLPEVGIYVRVKKSWAWIRWLDWEWDAPGRSGDGATPKSVAGTLRRYYTFLARRNFDGNLFDASKHMCIRSSGEEAAALGYLSTASLAQALSLWVNFHRWSLRTILEASSHTGGGVDYQLENQRVVVFVLLPRHLETGKPSTSADAFVLEQGGIVFKDERSFLAAQWPRLEWTCKIMANAMWMTLSATERHAFAGFMPVAFHFKATRLVAFHQYPLYRLTAHECGPSYDHPRITEDEKVFSDVASICGLLINRGVVVRAPRDDEPVLEAEVLVRSRKHWKWSPADSKWDTQDVAFDAPDPSCYHSGLPPTELYRRYHKSLTQRNFE
ncbi:hypothetical protein GSI_07313 [Ganoderma sinense ZZ0214-1]|uniref:Uncharacterized protein n=1 Tax=Ganoderma sinense ZZ0214-1 TaxID=1077348 RepID=A0A2G8SA27_9APHY|nr:hypothetical protein GSI_07313 [Ganoderma sinense ZZ0214-1]